MEFTGAGETHVSELWHPHRITWTGSVTSAFPGCAAQKTGLEHRLLQAQLRHGSWLSKSVQPAWLFCSISQHFQNHKGGRQGQMGPDTGGRGALGRRQSSRWKSRAHARGADVLASGNESPVGIQLLMLQTPESVFLPDATLANSARTLSERERVLPSGEPFADLREGTVGSQGAVATEGERGKLKLRGGRRDRIRESCGRCLLRQEVN
uniref:Uncharacterized protein n=1 Tax=Molossus molossus TaxID=27622 RepID=A0A7J8GQZ8_MOLMO|nr:hypothetical protein HJG59_011388 [Molossus molossus]